MNRWVFLTNVFLFIYASLDLKDSFLPNFSYTKSYGLNEPVKNTKKIMIQSNRLKTFLFHFS